MEGLAIRSGVGLVRATYGPACLKVNESGSFRGPWTVPEVRGRDLEATEGSNYVVK